MKNGPRSWRLGISALLVPAIATGAAACFDTSGLGDDGTGSGTTSNGGDASTTGTNGDASSGNAVDAGGGGDDSNRAIDIAAGQNFGCAVLASHSVWCWGSNNYGQVGQSPTSDLVAPTQVPGISDAVSIRAGAGFACVLKSDHTVACWGNNVLGQLGHDPSTDPLCTGNFACNPTPTIVAKASFAQAISANYSNACEINSEGAVYCWGENTLGQLGFVGDGGIVPTPTAVSGARAPNGGLENGTSVTCFSDPSTGNVHCLGSNYDNALGHDPGTNGDIDSGYGYEINTNAEPVADPTNTALGGFSQFCYGSLHGCGIVSGAATCWGRFGGPNGIYVENPTTHEVTGTAGATQVACGAFHSCILQGSAGDVLCWGNNWDLAVGTGVQDGGTYGAVQNPTPVGIQAVLLRGGYGQTLAIDHDGAVWQWGGGGAFADASTQPTPRKVEGLP